MTNMAELKNEVATLIERGATEQEIDAYILDSGSTPEALREVPVTLDVLKSIPSGVARGVAGIVGLPRLGADLVSAGVGFGGEQLGFGRGSDAGPSIQLMPSADDATGVVEGVTGPLYKPQTRAGEYARTVGEFLPNALMPGTIPQRLIAGVAAPALASEAAGQFTEGTRLETPARIAGALAGSLGATGAMQALNARKSGVPGMSSGSSRVLEKNITPDAEANLDLLGPEAFLFEAGQPSIGIAKGIAARPGAGEGRLVDSLIERQSGANQRLGADIQAAAGPAHIPSVVESTLKQQRDLIGKEYNAATRGGQRVDVEPIVKTLSREIELEAGLPRKALSEIKSYLYKEQKVKNAAGEIETRRVLKTSPAEILNVRQAIDDLIQTTTQPNAIRQAVIFREKIDNALGRAAPEIHRIDARFSEVAKQSEALQRGGQVLNTGKEAIRPFELVTEINKMTPAQRDMLAKGARSELERIVGTSSNDVTKLKQLIQSEGDWNREKLGKIFGADKADRMIAAIERESKFQDTYRKIVENSQTAQRLAGMKAVEMETGRGQSMRDLTALGAVAAAGQKAKDVVRGAIGKATRSKADDELARALATKGQERDRLIAQIRQAQAKRSKGSTTASNELLRLLLATQSATAPTR